MLEPRPRPPGDFENSWPANSHLSPFRLQVLAVSVAWTPRTRSIHLGRSLQDLVGFLSELHALGVDLFLHQQGLDTTTPGGKAMFQMMGVFAEFERAMIQERVRAGLARARGRASSSAGPGWPRTSRTASRKPWRSLGAPACASSPSSSTSGFPRCNGSAPRRPALSPTQAPRPPSFEGRGGAQ
jgi:hypothetical protein